jgi:hypothetical protein
VKTGTALASAWTIFSLIPSINRLREVILRFSGRTEIPALNRDSEHFYRSGAASETLDKDLELNAALSASAALIFQRARAD